MKIMSLGRLLVVAFAALTCANCSAVSDLIDALTNADCDDFVLDEVSVDLSEECRELEDYLDENADSLTGTSGTGLSQMFPINNLAEDKIVLMQLTDSTGSPIAGIDAADVTVEVSSDSGATFVSAGEETISQLSEGDTTQLAFVATIDYSGSILDSDLDDVVAGLDVFFENIEVGYEAAIVKFSTAVDVIQDFTSDSSALLDAVNDTDYDRKSTSLNDAIYDSADMLAVRDKPLKLVVLFTDGIDNDSDRSQDEAVTLAQANNVAVCVVGVGFADVDTLREIAADTGCFFVYKTVFTDLSTAFNTVVDQFNSLYQVTLPSTFNTATGILRVSVDVGESTARQFTGSF